MLSHGRNISLPSQYVVGLELATGGEGLQPLDGTALRAQGLAPGSQVDMLPSLPPSWARTLDSLRPTRERDENERDWRARPLQPLVFEPLERVGEDRVLLHLVHPLVPRVLSRFLSQGYSAHDLSRVTIVPSDRDHVVRVIAFARVSLFGRGATRLHDAVLTVAAQWLENGGEGHLRPFTEAAENRAVTQLDDIFARGKSRRRRARASRPSSARVGQGRPRRTVARSAGARRG